MKIYLKNMVCDRCKAAVTDALEQNKLKFKSVSLGEIELESAPSPAVLSKFREAVEQKGFEWIEDKSSRLVNQLKSLVIEWVRGEANDKRRTKFSAYLAEQLNKDYSSLSSLFSSVEGTTIEQFVIQQKVERAKELLVYDELNLGQIAELLGYSSVQHLSNQFKKITGLTPSHFKKIGSEKRLSLDKV